MSAVSGQTLSHYRLVERIGAGGMGVVWKADDLVLGRWVAIKVLPTDLMLDEGRRRMFLDEARLLASVSHANIVQVHELGREGNLDFIVMEFVPGKPLSGILQGRPLHAAETVDWGLQIAQGLARAHRAGVVHRDLKPANILVTPEGEAKIVDFGLAALIPPSESTTMLPLPSKADSSTVSQPVPGPLVETLPYMSPEQVRGRKPDERSDIFSLGSVLYEMTTGCRPFQGSHPAEVAAEILRSRPTPVHDLVPKVPLELDRIIEKAMARRPEDRYQIVDDLAVDLRRLAKEIEAGSTPSYDDLKVDRPRLGIRRLLAAGVALILLTAAYVAWQTWLRPRFHAGQRERTVLVLPMELRGQAEGAEYAGRAFSEAVAMNLAQLDQIRVLPVPGAADVSSLEGEERARTLHKLDVDLLLTGSMTREDQGIAAALTAIDAQRNRILCGVQERSDERDLSRIASTLTGKLAQQLKLTVPRRYDYFRNVTWSPAMASSPGLRKRSSPCSVTWSPRLWPRPNAS